MSSVALFNKWAGEHEWSDWAKPTLFAQAGKPLLGIHEPAQTLFDRAVKFIDESAARSASPGTPSRRVALVVDIPGDLSVAVGAVLSRRGFAPVPLFNGVHSDQSPLVDNASVLNALTVMADRLVPGGSDPAPAFLLDSQRLVGAPAPGRYDNRWIVFPQDLPSGGRLMASGIRECSIIAANGTVQDDLCHVLKRWQDAGIDMFMVREDRREATTIATPPWYKHLFYRVAALTGMRPNSYGAFGALIPIVTASSGYS